MASGFVKAELSTCRHGRPQVTCRLLLISVLLLVFGLILWKWMNGVDSLGSNQECRIGYKHSHSRVSQCLASIRKLGHRRSSEGLRSFKPSKGTNLFIPIILAGDIEMNPGPRFQCGLCKKYCKASDRLTECEECEKRFHASCSNLGDDELLKIESGDGAWYCTSCKADCGLCSGAVLKGHKAVQCDSCDMWIHNECSFITETQHETVSNTNCTWICPKCEFSNFSDSFYGEQVNLEIENRFVPLTKEKKDRSPPCGTNKNTFISGLKFISMNINSIRGKKKNWNCWLSLSLISHMLQLSKKPKLTVLLQLQNSSRKLAHIVYIQKTEISMVAGSCCSSIKTCRICLSQNWKTTRNQFGWKCLQTKLLILWQVGIDRLVALMKNSNYLENNLITLGLIIRVKSYPQSMSYEISTSKILIGQTDLANQVRC